MPSHGLREVNDRNGGIRRVRRGKAFAYVDGAGKPVRRNQTLARINSLAIPPAWTDVWICRSADGHIQATGRDARSRKQYRYHPEWESWREEQKKRRLLELAEVLPRMRRQVRRDLNSPGLTREKVLALMVRLLELTSIRAGHSEYAVQNGSYGLASMKDGHARIEGERLELRFRGKGGKLHAITVDDPLVRRLVAHCRRLPGSTLFQYCDETGRTRGVRARDLNAYLKSVSGANITAKDLRTWSASVLAFSCLRKLGIFRSAAEAKRNIRQTICKVAERLGNTPAICRKSYIHAEILEAYAGGALSGYPVPGRAGHRRDEVAVHALLSKRREDRRSVGHVQRAHSNRRRAA